MKKLLSYISIVLFSFFAFSKIVLAEEVSFCVKASAVMQIGGYFFLILKIVIPLIIIVLASIDFGSAVLSGEDKVIKEKALILLKRIIIGIVIFLIPTIVRVLYFGIFDLNGRSADQSIKNDASRCIDCLTNPGGCVVEKNLTILK